MVFLKKNTLIGSVHPRRADRISYSNAAERFYQSLILGRTRNTGGNRSHPGRKKGRSGSERILPVLHRIPEQSCQFLGTCRSWGKFGHAVLGQCSFYQFRDISFGKPDRL